MRRIPALAVSMQWLRALFTAQIAPLAQHPQDCCQDLIDAMPDPVLVIGRDFRICSANAEYAH